MVPCVANLVAKLVHVLDESGEPVPRWVGADLIDSNRVRLAMDIIVLHALLVDLEINVTNDLLDDLSANPGRP